MLRDIHKYPFDEGTKVKLSLFDSYLTEWLPVFISIKKPIWKNINICDFFAGPGSDINGFKGSPMIILDRVKTYYKEIEDKNFNINLIFNEYNRNKNKHLTNLVTKLEKSPCKINITELEFADAFKYVIPLLKNSANLLFFDQNGFKHITKDIFLKIINIKTTDFLFFISSSILNRFSRHPTIRKLLNVEINNETNYYDIHRTVTAYYKNFIPREKEYYLSSFSIKKGSNIYGIIFGSNNPLGIYKFLKICWINDPVRGEANYDIDKESIDYSSPSLFAEMDKPKKLELFEKELENKILNKDLSTDKEIVSFTLTNGFLPSHAKAVVNALLAKKKIKKNKLTLSIKVYNRNTVIKKIEL